MATTAQIEANRKNAQLSTGPRTIEGKARTSKNALTHGLTAKTALIKGELPEEFDAHAAEMLAELRPCGPLENTSARRIVLLSWQLQRATILQTAAINADIARYAEPRVPLLATIGQVVNADFAQCRTVQHLQLYETRIENSLYKALLHLQRLQTRRLAQPAPFCHCEQRSDEAISTPTTPLPPTEKSNPILPTRPHHSCSHYAPPADIIPDRRPSPRSRTDP